jgi:hypothetical protein
VQNYAYSMHSYTERPSPWRVLAATGSEEKSFWSLTVARDGAQLSGQKMVRRPGTADGDLAVL